MADKSSVPQFCIDASWYSWYGCHPGIFLYNQNFGQPPLLDARDVGWMESVVRKLGSSRWPGYTRPPALAAFLGASMNRKVCEEANRWNVSLDVNHFAPAELNVTTHGGFLQIEGKHEERQDEHGFVSRSFVRKYRLPVGVDAEAIKSILTGDGILIVEAPLPSIPPPADVTIPVQVETPEGKQDTERAGGDETAPDESEILVQPGAGEQAEDKAEIQQTDSDESFQCQVDQSDTPTGAEGEQEETFPTRTQEQQEQEQAEVPTEARQQEVEIEKIEEGVPEETTEGEGDVVEGLQDSGDVPTQIPQSSDTVAMEQVEEGEVEEGEMQRFEDESQHLSSAQVQEEIASPQEVLEQQEKLK